MALRTEALVNVSFAVAALVLAGIALNREFGPAAERPKLPEHDILPPTPVENWDAMAVDGMRIGPADAPLQIVEFTDPECPACAGWHLNAFEKLSQRHGEKVSLLMVHVALPQHRFARQASVAAECALAQGQLERFMHTVFTKQDSIGLKSWVSYALEAGVNDTARFESCRSAPPPPRIAAGMKLAKAIRVTATPTLIINGWRWSHIPDVEELDRILKRVTAGETPYAESGQ
jgi:protein-disulfide isomerase